MLRVGMGPPPRTGAALWQIARSLLRVAVAVAVSVSVSVSVAACSAASSPGDRASNSVTSSAPAPTDAATATRAAASVSAKALAESTEIVAANPPPTDPPASRCGTPRGDHTLYVWHRFAGEVVPQWFADQIEAFESARPDVAVVVDKAPGDVDEQLADIAALPDEQRPDVILGPAHGVRMQFDAHQFIPPAECTGGETPAVLADLLPIIAHHYTVEGVLQAVPYNVSAPVLMYDRARWRAAGLDPDAPPRTFEGLYAAIDALVASGQTRTGLALSDQAASWLISQNVARNGSLLAEPANGRGGRRVDRIVFDHPGIADLLARLHELKSAGKILWLGPVTDDTTDLMTLVLGELPDVPDAGMTFHTSGSIGDIYEYLELDAFRGVEIGVAPIPGDADGPATGTTVGGSAWWLVDRGDPAQAGAAWELVEWLAQPERIAELAAVSGYVPTSPTGAAAEVTQSAWAARPELRVAYDELAAMPGTDAASGWQVGPTLAVERQLELAAASIDDGRDPTDALAELAAAAERSVDAYANSFD